MTTKRLKSGTCIFCSRMALLTFHHLIPKKVHRRKFFKKNYSKDELHRGIDICRLCHIGIHDLYDEMQLAKVFNTVETLKNDEALLKHFNWVAKQKVVVSE
ncbi:MAG: hypothetical protein COA78_38735 [Blastopirellula sp.]|nr:MAG: hypothetical protein COA78_38735 [Blastopirellula sp.]